MKKLIYLLVFLSVPAFAQLRSVPIDFSSAPPEDWPKLDERLTELDDLETVRRFCNVRKNFPSTPIKGCAVVSFEYQLCMIYIVKGDQEGLEHERAHCQGYNHVGENGKTEKAWEQWKSNRTGGLSTPQ
jgi:hypothetical protein